MLTEWELLENRQCLGRKLQELREHAGITQAE